jgi:hypothetical protein
MDSESAFVVIDVVVFVQPLSAGAGSNMPVLKKPAAKAKQPTPEADKAKSGKTNWQTANQKRTADRAWKKKAQQFNHAAKPPMPPSLPCQGATASDLLLLFLFVFVLFLVLLSSSVYDCSHVLSVSFCVVALSFTWLAGSVLVSTTRCSW